MGLSVRHRVLVTDVEHFAAILDVSVVAWSAAGTLEVGLDSLSERVLRISDHGSLVDHGLFSVDVACGFGVSNSLLDLKSNSKEKTTE